jgi:hypothetical protein
MYHRQRVCAQDELAAEQPRQTCILWCGADWVAHVGVNVEVRARRGQLRAHCHSDPAVGRLVSYRLCSGSLDIENDPVVKPDRGDLTNCCAGCLSVVLKCLGLKVDVARRSALVESGEQGPALQHKPIGEPRSGQPSEERLQDIELQQLVDGALFLPCELPQVEVGGGQRRRLESERSQEDFECLADRLLRASELLGDLDKLRGACARLTQPSPQRFPCDVAALEMAGADDVDK